MESIAPSTLIIVVINIINYPDTPFIILSILRSYVATQNSVTHIPQDLLCFRYHGYAYVIKASANGIILTFCGNDCMGASGEREEIISGNIIFSEIFPAIRRNCIPGAGCREQS